MKATRWRVVLIIIGLFSLVGSQSVYAQEMNPLAVSDRLITHAYVHVPTLMEAYSDFRRLEGQLEFKDLADYEGSIGMSVADLEAVMEVVDIEPQYIKYTDREEMIYYTYESDEMIEEINVPQNTDIGFMFDDGQLISMVITAQAYYVPFEDFYMGDDIGQWVADRLTVSQVPLMEDTVLAYARLLYDETVYHAVNIMSTDAENQQMMDNLIFEEDILIESSYYIEDAIPVSLVDSNMYDLIYTVAEDYLKAREEGASVSDSGTDSISIEWEDETQEEVPSLTSEQLDGFLNETTFINSAMVLAYEDYKRIVDEFEFEDADLEQENASTKADVLEAFEDSGEVESFTGTGDSEYVKFTYEANDDTAGLYVYFYNDSLVYASVSVDEADTASIEPINQARFLEVVDQEASVALAEANIPVFAFGTLKYNGEMIMHVLAPVSRETDLLYEGIYLIRGNEILSYQTEPVDSYLNRTQDEIIQIIQGYLVP